MERKKLIIIIIIASFIMIGVGVFLTFDKKTCDKCENEVIDSMQEKALEKLMSEYPLENNKYILKEETAEEYRFVEENVNNVMYAVNKQTLKTSIITIIQ